MTRRGPIGMPGYARVACLLNGPPMSAATLAARLGRSRNGIHSILRRLHAVGVVHIAAWHTGRTITALWKFGPGADADKPARKRGQPGILRPAPKPLGRAGAVAFAVLIRTLEVCSTVRELCEATGSYEMSIRRTLSVLGEGGIAHIHQWERTGNDGPAAASWMLGRRADAKRPEPVFNTPAHQRRAWSERARRLKYQRMAHVIVRSAERGVEFKETEEA